MSFDHYGVKRSINELNSIFSCQWSNGMLPHIRFAPLPSLGPALPPRRRGLGHLTCRLGRNFNANVRDYAAAGHRLVRLAGLPPHRFCCPPILSRSVLQNGISASKIP